MMHGSSVSLAKPFRWLLVAGVIALGAVAPAHAGPIAFGTWLEFGFEGVGVPAVGCDPADPAGAFCIASSGTPTVFLDAPPWTFTAPAGGAVLKVTDAFEAGDAFAVFDFGAPVGITSPPIGAGDCGDDPVPCLADPDISKALFALAPGDHSIAITPTLSPSGGGSAYFRVDEGRAIPEPATLLLTAAGIVMIGGWSAGRRKRGRRGRIWRRVLGVVVLGCLVGIATVAWHQRSAGAGASMRFTGPTSSQPLALTADNAFLIVANPDNNSVTFFDLRNDRNRRLAEVPVQKEPYGVAMLPNGSKAYVANTVSGTVSVMRLNIANGRISRPHKHIPVGTEPYGLALTPNGTKLYVTNARSDTVSVIDTATDTVIKTINVGPEPRGIAITNDGDADDNDETIYLTQFLSVPIPGKVDGADDAKAGLVSILSTATDSVIGVTVLNPIADTGFKAAGDALARIPPGSAFTFTTGAYPNQMNNIGIRGNFAFLPNTGASPNGPVRFNVNTQSLLHVMDLITNMDAGRTINMHTAVRDQLSSNRRFITQPWAIACKHGADECFVASAASDILVKVNVDPNTGQPAVQTDTVPDPVTTTTTQVRQIPTGKNPRGIVINSTDTRAYVMNHVSRNVTVLNLTTTPETVHATLQSAALPTPGTLADKIHIGKELYYTSIGTFDPPAQGQPPIVGRMSNAGWGSCGSCHPFGLTDNVVWIFAAGPRRTIPQHTDFDQTDPTRSIQRALNWSGIFDEEQDFELNIRGVSGGLGLFVQADGISQDNTPPVAAFDPANGPPNSTRKQLTVRGVGAWDALKAFVQFGIRAPISPVSKSDPDVIAGEALFRSANCQQCHGGPQWTSSRVRFTPPPNPALIVNGQIVSELRQVGTFDPAFFNEVRANAAPPLGADGFAPASLLSIFAFPQTFLHNGAARSLDQVLNNVTHRSAGTGGVDTLTNPADRARVVEFLLSIDAATPPIP